jgi:hypothetical protein
MRAENKEMIRTRAITITPLGETPKTTIMSIAKMIPTIVIRRGIALSFM